jgi:hypothetical protein
VLGIPLGWSGASAGLRLWEAGDPITTLCGSAQDVIAQVVVSRKLEAPAIF